MTVSSLCFGSALLSVKTGGIQNTRRTNIPSPSISTFSQSSQRDTFQTLHFGMASPARDVDMTDAFEAPAAGEKKKFANKGKRGEMKANIKGLILNDAVCQAHEEPLQYIANKLDLSKKMVQDHFKDLVASEPALKASLLIRRGRGKAVRLIRLVCQKILSRKAVVRIRTQYHHRLALQASLSKGIMLILTLVRK